MPIRFRCSYCNRLLGIATRKAGTETLCPHCGYSITVPISTEDDSNTERVNVDDVAQLLGNEATERAVTPGTQVVEAATPPRHAEQPRTEPQPVQKVATGSPAKPRPAPPPLPHSPEDRPLFEADVDAILGTTATPEEASRPKAAPTSGLDAMSLGEPSAGIVISAQKATLLTVAVVVLLALAFAAGYFLAPKG